MCEPLLTHRNIYMVAPKLGREGCPRTKARPGGGSSARERPACGLGGARCIGGVSSLQALAWNRRTRRPDSDGQAKWAKLALWSREGGPQASNTARGTSTEAGHGGGPTRSSEEGSVMGLEPRGRVDQGHTEANPQGEEPKGRPKPEVKSFEIRKRLIYQAWEKVRANRGAPGVDAVSIAEFAGKERDNLYKLWNPMSSGSYFPGPVRAAQIPKDHGAGVRTLGVPNTADRVAQTAAAMLLEEKLEPIFHSDSYGYRPGRSAHDALAVCRQRCPGKDWVLGLDIRAFFDSVPQDLLLRSGSSPHRRALGSVMHRAVAESPDADARRDRYGAREGDPPGIADLTPVGQPVPALRVRSVDGPGVPGLPLGALRG